MLYFFKYSWIVFRTAGPTTTTKTNILFGIRATIAISTDFLELFGNQRWLNNGDDFHASGLDIKKNYISYIRLLVNRTFPIRGL